MTGLIGAFFSAALLFNAIPHLVQGICGKRHMSPFFRRVQPCNQCAVGLGESCGGWADRPGKPLGSVDDFLVDRIRGGRAWPVPVPGYFLVEPQRTAPLAQGMRIL